ncbi:MAG: 4Fe-4S dicluster domain-containing protein [candidate division WOR-3 bacterium]
MEYYLIPSTKFVEWLSSLLDEFLVYLPIVEEEKCHFHQLKSKDLETIPSTNFASALKKIRASESLKGFFFLPRELVLRGFETPQEKDFPKQLIIGAKNCDLLPLQVHRRMFLEGNYIDPFYQQRLDRTVIISADCPEPAETCFCNLLGLTPYPSKEIFATEFPRVQCENSLQCPPTSQVNPFSPPADINLTVLRDGFLLEPFTEKGEALIASRPNLIRAAREEEIEEKQEQRLKAERNLKAINPQALPAGLALRVEKMQEEKFWDEHSKTCVECFACLMICPTCFCYLLYDQAKANNNFERLKIWDACYYPAYARVGGGMNPRAEFLQRFKNRFHCKFMNFYLDHNFYACSGCGRCLSACSGKIDIRKILFAL